MDPEQRANVEISVVAFRLQNSFSLNSQQKKTGVIYERSFLLILTAASCMRTSVQSKK
jgi:hypothetical protein